MRSPLTTGLPAGHSPGSAPGPLFVFPTRQLPAPLPSPISSISLTLSAFLSLTLSAGAPDGRSAWCSRKSAAGISANNGLFLSKEMAQRLKILHFHKDYMRKRLLLYPFTYRHFEGRAEEHPGRNQHLLRTLFTINWTPSTAQASSVPLEGESMHSRAAPRSPWGGVGRRGEH